MGGWVDGWSSAAHVLCNNTLSHPPTPTPPTPPPTRLAELSRPASTPLWVNSYHTDTVSFKGSASARTETLWAPLNSGAPAPPPRTWASTAAARRSTTSAGVEMSRVSCACGVCVVVGGRVCQRYARRSGGGQGHVARAGYPHPPTTTHTHSRTLAHLDGLALVLGAGEVEQRVPCQPRVGLPDARAIPPQQRRVQQRNLLHLKQVEGGCL